MHKILIVDDNADIRELISLTLDNGDYEFREAANGEDALAECARWQPDLVVLDVMMPGQFDGIAVCKTLRADPRYADTKVLMLTARGQERDLDVGYAAGASAYLVKPFSPIEMHRVIAGLLTRPAD